MYLTHTPIKKCIRNKNVSNLYKSLLLLGFTYHMLFLVLFSPQGENVDFLFISMYCKWYFISHTGPLKRILTTNPRIYGRSCTVQLRPDITTSAASLFRFPMAWVSSAIPTATVYLHSAPWESGGRIFYLLPSVDLCLNKETWISGQAFGSCLPRFRLSLCPNVIQSVLMSRLSISDSVQYLVPKH